MKKMVSYEHEKFNNFCKIMSDLIKTTEQEMTTSVSVDLFPTKREIMNRAYNKFCQLKRMGFYDNLNRLNLKVCERV